LAWGTVFCGSRVTPAGAAGLVEGLGEIREVRGVGDPVGDRRGPAAVGQRGPVTTEGLSSASVIKEDSWEEGENGRRKEIMCN